MRIVLSNRANADLLRTYQYLAEPSPSAADAFIQRVDLNFRNLTNFPFIGRERSSLALGLRCLIVGLHLIFYTVEADEIAIVRVIDGRMDVDEEFHR